MDAKDLFEKRRDAGGPAKSGACCADLVEDLTSQQLEELLGNAALIQPFFFHSSTDEGHPQGLLQLTGAVHELVQGILQHICAADTHIQVLHHGRVHTLEQSLHTAILA